MKVIGESHIYETLYPTVEKNLSINANVEKLIKAISKYVDKWSHILLSTNFSERMIFSDYDKQILYEVCGLDIPTIKQAIKESTIIQSQWKVATNEFYVLSVLVMRYFLKNNKQNEFLATSLYLGYPLFISSHFGSFRHLPNAAIMEYTINNLSNRYIIKQEKTIQGMIEYTIMNALEGRYSDELIACTDEDIKDVIYALEVRISNNMKNIAEEFYKNHKNEKFIFKQSDNYSEEEYHIADNVSYGIYKVASAATRSIVESGFDYETVISRSCNLNAGASPKKLKSIMDTIVEKDRASIEPFIVDIISLFVYKGVGNNIQELKSLKFLSESLQNFKSNSQDEITVKVKDKLLAWIELTGEKYGRTFISKGKTAIDTYRRSIYTCFMLKIMLISKGGV